MKDNEIIWEHFLIMKQLCSHGNTEDEALMQYFINEINDSVLKKTFLYGCMNIEEFKQKLKVFEKTRRDCEKMKFRKSKVEVKSDVKIKMKPLRNDICCFNCALAGHKSTNYNNERKKNTLISVFSI